MPSPHRWTRGNAPRWSFSPPPPRVRKYDRLKVQPGKGERLVIISSRIEEIGTHYVDGRTMPCTGPDGQCELDHRVVGNPRYSGWLVVRLFEQSKPQLLSLTPVAVTVEPRLRDTSLDLRGLTLRVWRTGPHERSEMHASLLLDVPRVDVLQQCPDVRFCVERMMAAEDRPDALKRRDAGILARAARAAQIQDERRKGGQS